MYDRQNARCCQIVFVVAALLLYALPATSGEVYHWVDDTGQIHYGDRPVTGAKTIELHLPAPVPTTVDQEKPAVVNVNTPSPPETAKVLTAGELADCLRRKGAKLYSASWCPQCAKQRGIFGSAENSLPMVECSINGGRKQTSTCKDANIKAYPTWVFADGSRYAGVGTLAALARRSGCDIR